jgi:hypothetical protein
MKMMLLEQVEVLHLLPQMMLLMMPLNLLHLKLPHYVDFQSELELVRRMRAQAALVATGCKKDLA